ncbi:2-hydroxyacid dehydrogenase [Caryophanon latum]|uniref:D-glycerate dehydrogenase n=1 Tax=Caryophanon latum TaxID=33977 RepID=A0A1C0Z459_9BACL|nr:D-glycerate dehydrogenase [Caryophanon latum]OCS94269.1 D-glycerate dehydrogenase [Caryophanon latum]
MKKVLITRKFPEQFVTPLREVAEVIEWHEELEVMPRAELLAQVGDVDAIWATLEDRIDEELLDRAPKLKMVSNLAVGYNNLSIDLFKERGIMSTNTPNVLTNATADLAFGLLIATARRLVEGADYLRAGEWKGWSPMQLTGMEVSGATIGIIGMGRIGSAVARRSRGFDMEVLYHNRNRKYEHEEMYGFRYRQLDDLLKESDFVVVLTPYTAETHHLIGERELKLMKKTAVLINVSRGGIVDEDALYNALLNKDIWAAGLDVFEKEPIALDHPLLTLPNVVALPHIASASVKTRHDMFQTNLEALLTFIDDDKPKNRLT